MSLFDLSGPMIPRKASLGLTLLLALASVGCTEKVLFPVTGQLVDQKGNPITGMKGGVVEFESLDFKASANGAIDEHGNFRLSTLTPGDGAHTGKHRVLIMRPFASPETPAPQIVHAKYEKQASTDLFVNIEPKSTVIKLEVELHQP